MTIDQLLYTITVPCAKDSFTVLEGLTETFLANIPGASPDELLRLRLSVAEGCRNALAQSPAAGAFGVTTMTFYGGRFNNTARAVEIDDPGLGLEIGGHRPPYPTELIGTDYTLADVLGERLVARVVSDRHVVLRAEGPLPDTKAANRKDLLASARADGYGLLTLCETWESVEFFYDPRRGNSLRLAGPRPLLQDAG